MLPQHDRTATFSRIRDSQSCFFNSWCCAHVHSQVDHVVMAAQRNPVTRDSAHSLNVPYSLSKATEAPISPSSGSFVGVPGSHLLWDCQLLAGEAATTSQLDPGVTSCRSHREASCSPIPALTSEALNSEGSKSQIAFMAQVAAELQDDVFTLERSKVTSARINQALMHSLRQARQEIADLTAALAKQKQDNQAAREELQNAQLTHRLMQEYGHFLNEVDILTRALINAKSNVGESRVQALQALLENLV